MKDTEERQRPLWGSGRDSSVELLEKALFNKIEGLREEDYFLARAEESEGRFGLFDGADPPPPLFV